MKVRRLNDDEYPTHQGRWIVENEDGTPERYNFAAEWLADVWASARKREAWDTCEAIQMTNLHVMQGRNLYRELVDIKRRMRGAQTFDELRQAYDESTAATNAVFDLEVAMDERHGVDQARGMLVQRREYIDALACRPDLPGFDWKAFRFPCEVVMARATRPCEHI